MNKAQMRRVVWDFRQREKRHRLKALPKIPYEDQLRAAPIRPGDSVTVRVFP